MLKALYETVSPKGGKGVNETVLFFAILIAIFTLNLLQIPVSPELKMILYAFLGSAAGYMVGTNKEKPKKKVDE